MAFPKLLGVLKRRFRIVVAIFLVSVVGTLLALAVAARSYTATAGIYVTVRTAASVDALAQAANFSQSQMSSIAALAVTPKVLEPVADTLAIPGGAGEIGDELSVNVVAGTTVLELSVSDHDPRRAAEIANAVAAQLIDVVEELAPQDSDQNQPNIKATVVRPASVPGSPSSPKTSLDLTAACVLGLGLGLLVALGREATDTRVRGAEQLVTVTGLPLLGSLPARSGRSRGLVLTSEPYGAQAEAYRQLRTNLQFLDVGTEEEAAARRARVLVVTSSVAGEGKSTTAANLAIALAKTSGRVLLVDADLRRPTVATLLGIEGAAGLTTVLLGEVEPADVVQDWGTVGLQVLPAGALPPNPGELLASPAMRRLLQQLRTAYDHIVIDSPPLLPVADGAILAAQADGAVVLANVTKVRRHQLSEALANLARVDARVLGVVLNQVARKGSTYGYATVDGSGERSTAAARIADDRRTDGAGIRGAVPVPAPQHR